MVRDEVIRRALERTNWDLLVCSMPSNVLLLSGYWPAAGYSLAIATRDGRIVLVVPEDEDDLAERSWADEVATYCPASLDRVMTAEEPVFEVFADGKAKSRHHGRSHRIRTGRSVRARRLCAQSIPRKCRKALAARFPLRDLSPRRRAFSADACHQDGGRDPAHPHSVQDRGAGFSAWFPSTAHGPDGGSDRGSVSGSAEFVHGGPRAGEPLRRLHLLHVRAELGHGLRPLFPFSQPEDCARGPGN